jgi:transcriptional regulator with XRE-family HTH domain
MSPQRPRADVPDYTTPAVTGHNAAMARMLRAEIAARGLTQREFAQLVRASEERVSLVLRCIRRADPATLDRWARALGAQWQVHLVETTGRARK